MLFNILRWLLLDNNDPQSQLKWLINELLSAEETNVKVHIIGHVSPGACDEVYSHIFNKILTR